MTRDRDFKQRVRARAEKTGESYAAARSSMIGHAHHRRVHAETSALSVALEAAGVTLDEATILAIGGGIGAGYLAITHGMTGFMMGARAAWWDSPGFVERTCERLGLAVAFKETTSAQASVRNVTSPIARGLAPIAWVDRAALPLTTLGPEFTRSGYHVVAVTALDDARATVVDLADAPVEMTAGELARARASIGTYKNRVAIISPGESPPDVAGAVLAGLRACAETLVKARAKSFMLEGFRAWGESVLQPKGKQAWAALFPTDADRARALSWTYRFVELWSGPALLRPLFAAALDGAAKRLARPQLRDVAKKYRGCAEAWHAVARGALPDDLAPLRARREAMDDAERAYCKQDRAKLAAAMARLAELRGAPASGARERLAPLGAAILDAHALEVDAHAALSAAVS